MSTLLKQSTAFTFRIGPFVDSTDGVTAETGLSIGQADIQISKDGGAFAQTSASPTTTHDSDGWYQCPLTTTDTNTLGPLTVQITMSGALPVWRDFLVVPANVYDSLVDGSDNLQVDATQIEGSDATDQINAACDASIETYHLDHLLAAAYDPASKPGSGTSLMNVMVENDGGTPRYTANALEQGPSGGGSSGLTPLASGTAQAGANGTVTLASGASATNDLYNNQVVKLTGGTGEGQARIITDYVGSTKVASVSPDWTTNPDATSEYEIVEAAADIRQLSGDTTSADNLEADYDGSGYNKSNSTIGTCTTNTDMRGTDSALTSADEPVDANVTQLGGVAQSLTDLKDFADAGYDPATNKVEGVKLVDTTTTNTDMRGTDSAATASALSTHDGKLDTVDTNVDAILVDTNELQGDWTDGGRLDLIIDQILADTNELQTDDVPGLIAALNDISTADVLTQVNAALDTAISELGVAAPTATPTLRTGLMLIYMMARNKVDVTASSKEIHNDAGTVITSKALSDDGTTYSEAEMA